MNNIILFFSNFPGTKLRTFTVKSNNYILNFDGLKNNQPIFATPSCVLRLSFGGLAVPAI
jgi:hypothetical protein